MKQKIGIMGGTFDPPHAGHLAMAERVRTVMALDQIWFVPTGGITYKADRDLSSPTERLEMTRLAVRDDPFFSVNPIEAESGKASYSYRTMETLTHAYPDTEFVFIVGADSLDYMDSWREPERLFRCCAVAAVNRTGIEWEEMEEKKKLLEERFHARIVLVSMPAVEISSTRLRQMIKMGERVDDYVKPSVAEYIKTHRLYR